MKRWSRSLTIIHHDLEWYWAGDVCEPFCAATWKVKYRRSIAPLCPLVSSETSRHRISSAREKKDKGRGLTHRRPSARLDPPSVNAWLSVGTKSWERTLLGWPRHLEVMWKFIQVRWLLESYFIPPSPSPECVLPCVCVVCVCVCVLERNTLIILLADRAEAGEISLRRAALTLKWVNTVIAAHLPVLWWARVCRGGGRVALCRPRPALRLIFPNVMHFIRQIMNPWRPCSAGIARNNMVCSCFKWTQTQQSMWTLCSMLQCMCLCVGGSAYSGLPYYYEECQRPTKYCTALFFVITFPGRLLFLNPNMELLLFTPALDNSRHAELCIRPYSKHSSLITVIHSHSAHARGEPAGRGRYSFTPLALASSTPSSTACQWWQALLLTALLARFRNRISKTRAINGYLSDAVDKSWRF